MQNIFTNHLKVLSCRISMGMCRYYCDFGFKHTYTEDQVRNILKIINSSSQEELARYSIAKFRLQKITSWKQQHGQFESLNEILNLDDFGVKVLDKLCQSIVKDTGKSGVEIPTAKKSSQILTPKLSEERRMQIKSLCSVQIGTDSVSWCRLELQDAPSPTLVTHWQYFPLNSKRSHLADLTQRILHVNQMIPSCDAFVLETPITRPTSQSASAVQISVNVQHSQLIAMISVILAQRMQDFDPCVFFIRKYLDARLFGTLVGQERISSLDVVTRILAIGNVLNETSNEGDSKAIVQAFPDILTKYNTSEGAEKEYMGRSLMLATCFLRLCILKCPKSLAIVNRRAK
ncbi:uncharacterized protein LOC129795653 [Lutzomyia longipalpis]|uniref:uncharacterized protein LOC129795653 n=1 Tax=Lutzomyia longipalpis TaxID=7200 RepID=UPI00248361A6|nr:uncharacterized protein LOC129795653 [Lutzomyia longipalpis]